LVVGIAIPVAEKSKGVPERLLVGHVLYVLQFLFTEPDCAYFPFQRCRVIF